jgi:hypothetical protein
MKSRFFSATRKQVRALGLMSILVVLLFFAPAIRWLGQVVVRANPDRSGHIQVDVPRNWMVREGDHTLEIWKPCITILCPGPSAELSIQTGEKFVADEQTWEHGAQVAFTRLGFSGFATRDIQNRDGATTCVEASAAERREVQISTCFQPGSGITGIMRSRRGHLDAVYEIFAKSVRAD